MRWAESVENFRSQGVTLCGDVLLISAFVSYVGYFTKKYRNELMEKFWVPYINQLKVRAPRWLGLRETEGQPRRYAAHAAPSLGLRQPYLLGLSCQLTWPGHTSGPGPNVSLWGAGSVCEVLVVETWGPES